jgi:hypothetical protein
MPSEAAQVLAMRSGGEQRVHCCTPSRGAPGECEQEGWGEAFTSPLLVMIGSTGDKPLIASESWFNAN